MENDVESRQKKKKEGSVMGIAVVVSVPKVSAVRKVAKNAAVGLSVIPGPKAVKIAVTLKAVMSVPKNC